MIAATKFKFLEDLKNMRAEEYDYDKFISDSSDDYPSYEQLVSLEDDELKSFRIDNNVDKELLDCFREVILLARLAIQPWWSEEYKNESEEKIKKVEGYFDSLKNKK